MKILFAISASSGRSLSVSPRTRGAAGAEARRAVVTRLIEAAGSRVPLSLTHRIYGPRECRERGGIVAFNLRRGHTIVRYEDVEAAAHCQSIALRGRCFCNPGAAEHAFGIEAGRARRCYGSPFSVARFRTCLGENAVGAVRASVGVATTALDVARLCDLLAGVLRRRPA